MSWKKMAASVIPVIALAAGSPASVRADLVINGSFESTTAGIGQLGYNTDVTGWTSPAPNGSYNYVFSSPTDAPTGQYGSLSLWNNSTAGNGMTASPDGGNFVGMDGAFDVGPLSQTINGLTAGQAYSVSFYWAGAQQSGFNGPTSDNVTVSLGSQSFTTQTVSLPSHGFSGWVQQTFTFTADSTSDVLSFLAYGTPNGVPPFALLDGVSMVAVASPEPSTLLHAGLGMFGLGAVWLRKRARAKFAVA
jgi:Protein of unknown function (DUF642)/PEP-CTERM motif